MHACMYYNMMASLCRAYAKLVGRSCGASNSNPSEVTIRTAGECCKDVKGHLRSVNCTDGSLNLELELFLARAGE